MTLTRFLENNMSSTLLGLPREIKELIYFDALSHAANKILVRGPALPALQPALSWRSRLFTVLDSLGTPTLPRCQEDQPQRRGRHGA